MFFYYNFKREEFMAHYQQRSNGKYCPDDQIEVGERLQSKNETAQINEDLTKVLCHNLCVVIRSMYELNRLILLAHSPIEKP